MSDSRDETVMNIVDAALDVETARRGEFVREACRSDPTLVERVEKLLAHATLAERAMQTGAPAGATAGAQASLARVGPYQLLGVIGEGGMGTVWRAEQREPIRRTVALKLIKLGMDSRAVVNRFEQERQALALMNHPNVARVFDAGAAADGRPYFAMEYVPGEPITTFCDRHSYTTADRLGLFCQACEAVQHAHQKAIIHRDIKPTNVLVTLVDGKPTVKVIDFGIAKATAAPLTERTLFTEQGQLVGTPEYMSPEQAEMGALDVDTRSDVYSLGVVLYELLSGSLPFDPKSLRSAAFNEIQRIIREVEPPRPSTRLSSLAEPAAAEVGRKRQARVDELARQLRGELEWIPLKAMRKDRSHRYASADELAQDIGNYLAGRPLRAGPESAAYRTRKFLRRNRGPVLAAALIVVALLAGITSTSVALVGQTRARAEAEKQRLEADSNRIEAERQRDLAGATLEFLTHDVLSGATPQRIPDPRVRDEIVRAMILPALDRMGTRLKDRPLVEASVRDAVRQTLLSLGRADLALPHARAALKMFRAERGDDHPETIECIHRVAVVCKVLGQHPDAEAHFREALDRARRVLGEDNPLTLTITTDLGTALDDMGRHEEAEQLHRSALAGFRRTHGDADVRTRAAIGNLAAVLTSRGRYAEAESLFQELVQSAPRPYSEGTLVHLGNLGHALKAQGRYAAAEPRAREALDGFRALLGPDHPSTLIAANNYASTLRAVNRLDEAESLLRDTVVRSRALFGPDHTRTITSLNNLAGVLKDRGNFDEAESMHRGVLETIKRTLGEQHPHAIIATHNLALVLMARADYAAAEPMLKQVFEMTRAVEMDEKQAAAFSSLYGICLVRLGKTPEAREALLDSWERMQAAGLGDGPKAREIVVLLEESCRKLGRADEAASWKRRAATMPAGGVTTSASAPASQPR